MISNPKHGWSNFDLKVFHGTSSYLTDVPVDLLNAFIQYHTTGTGIAWFDEEVLSLHDNRKLAEKIAQDYLTELRYYGNGKIYQKNIDLMNDRFAASFKEKERIRKEEEIK